jgi:pre-mRNA-splicing helicase BRR2
MADAVFAVLSEPRHDARACENRLVAALEHDKFALIKRLLKNRWRIVYCVRWARAKTDAERAELADEMKGNALLAPIHDALTRTGAASASSAAASSSASAAASSSKAVPAIVRAAADAHKLASSTATAAVKGKAILDLEALAFAQGGHFMSNPNCTLPEGTYTVDKKGYQEVHVPALKTADMGAHERLVDIASLPEWAHAAFAGMKTLNRVQSRLYQVCSATPWGWVWVGVESPGLER